VQFCQILECQAPCTNAKPPYWRLPGDSSAAYLSLLVATPTPGLSRSLRSRFIL